MQTNDEILGIKIQKYGLDKEAKPNEKGFYDYKDEAEFTDYSNAISLYKKTFPNKQKVIEETPDPAVSEMLLKMQDMGIETVFDRFDKQKPQCTFGMAGICCKICFMGPCKITSKATRGVCGADADVIVARNLLRHVAGGAAADGARG